MQGILVRSVEMQSIRKNLWCRGWSERNGPLPR